MDTTTEMITAAMGKGQDDNNEMLIKCEPLVYTRVQRSVHNKIKTKGSDSTTAITSSSMDSTPAETIYWCNLLSLTHTHSRTSTHTHTHTHHSKSNDVIHPPSPKKLKKR